MALRKVSIAISQVPVIENHWSHKALQHFKVCEQFSSFWSPISHLQTGCTRPM